MLSEQVQQAILDNPASFSESYPDRYVNSVYYDTPDFRFYRENVEGISNRVKYRIRWYGEDKSKIQSAVLEKKIKRNMLGTKVLERLDDLNLVCDAEAFAKLSILSDLDLQPVALVRYRRKYLESWDRNIRATVDTDLNYYPLVSEFNDVLAYRDPAIILEIKYEEAYHDEADYCLQAIPFRLTKNSKYVSAFERIKGL